VSGSNAFISSHAFPRLEGPVREARFCCTSV
jgi:hypothetical protein